VARSVGFVASAGDLLAGGSSPSVLSELMNYPIEEVYDSIGGRIQLKCDGTRRRREGK